MAEPSTPADLLASLDERLRAQRGVDLALADTAHRLVRLSPNKGVQEARQLLLRRVSDLQSSVTDVSSAIQQLRELQQVVRFTEAGWPERQQELTKACKVDALRGVALWLDDWFTALAGMRLDACQRLVSIGEALPAGTEVLLRRCRVTAAALEKGTQDADWWLLAAPLIQAGGRGLRVGRETVPTPEIRRQLHVLLIRLWLAVGRPEEARHALEEAQETEEGPILEALKERLRLLGVQSRPETLQISATNSADALLEAARVLIGTEDSTVSDLQVDPGMAAARKAVAAPGSLDEARRQVVRMLAPVPAPIHLALAERAVTEGDDALAREYLEHAIEARTGGAVVAEAYERLAVMAQRAGHDEDSLRQRVQAAETWSDARPDRALSNAEQALALDGEHSEARCWVAASLGQLFWSSPDSSPSRSGNTPDQRHDARQQLHRALNMAVEVSASTRATDSWVRAWALYLTSCLADRLAEFAGERSSSHRWLALEAALEAILLQPQVEWDWLRLADAAYHLELWSLAEVAARNAAALSSLPEADEQHVRALINLGKYDEGLALLGEPANPYQWSMQGQALLHNGDVDEAAAVFAEHPPERDADWARVSNITALLLTGRSTEGLSAARDLDASLRPRFAESATWDNAAWVSLVLGDDGRVEDLAGRQRALGRHDSDLYLAVLRASQNRMDDAAALATSYVRSMTSLDDVGQWKIDLALLTMALAARKAPTPDLSDAMAALQQVREDLVHRRDPVFELQMTAAAAGDSAAAKKATRLAPMVLAIARQDVEGVERLLHELASTRDPASLSPLQAWLEGEKWRGVDDAEPAEPEDGASDQKPIATTEPETEIVPVLVRLSDSWFAGMDDPMAQHPLVPHLKEISLLTNDAVLPVRVRPFEALEPNRYLIAVYDEVVEQGTLPIGRRLLSAAALPLVPEEGDLAQPEEQPTLRQPGELTIPDNRDAERTFGGLLSQSALEALGARVERLASTAPPG